MERAQGGGPARYTHIRVLDDSDVEVWSARADPPGVSSGTPILTYGDPPPGFVNDTAPSPLEPGARYRLILSGHALGGLEFTVEVNRIVPG